MDSCNNSARQNLQLLRSLFAYLGRLCVMHLLQITLYAVLFIRAIFCPARSTAVSQTKPRVAGSTAPLHVPGDLPSGRT